MIHWNIAMIGIRFRVIDSMKFRQSSQLDFVHFDVKFQNRDNVLSCSIYERNISRSRLISSVQFRIVAHMLIETMRKLLMNMYSMQCPCNIGMCTHWQSTLPTVENNSTSAPTSLRICKLTLILNPVNIQQSIGLYLLSCTSKHGSPRMVTIP